ncbi:MAG: AAA family ATPase [Bacteroidota bacterium]|nr:AAA family ATPase [Bacteroidota bacterium]
MLVGQRRSGKSYLIRQIMQSLVDDGVMPENLFYFNTEYLYFDEIVLSGKQEICSALRITMINT